MKDSNVVAHTKEERFIRIQLPNSRCLHPGIVLTPESAFDDSTERAYTALRVSGIVSHSLLHNWNDANQHQAVALGDLLRAVGSEAIAQITYRFDNRFTDVEMVKCRTVPVQC
jgi:hypothetical protein